MPATIFVLFACLGPHTTAILSQLVAVPILPPPAVTGYYLSPGHETFTFRPFTGETQRTPRDFATFRLTLFTTFFTAHHNKVSPRGALDLPAARFLQTERIDPLSPPPKRFVLRVGVESAFHPYPQK